MLRVSGVYAIVNLANGKLYVGSSVNIISRWMNHRWELRNNRHSNAKLQRAWNKYGETNFKLRFLDICHPCDRVCREQEFIDSLGCCKQGYNMQTQAGHILITIPGKKKMSHARTKYFENDENRQRQTQHLRSLHNNPDIVKRRSEACRRTHAAGKVPTQTAVCKKASAAFHNQLKDNPERRAAWIASISAARRKQ